MLGRSVELSLFHRGVNHYLLRLNKEWILRVPTSQRDPCMPQSMRQLGRRMELFALSGHCVKAWHIFTEKELPPYGGLLVPFQAGRPLSLPADLPLLASCFAALHKSPATPTAARPDLHKIIATRRPLLAQAPLAAESRQLIDSFLDRAEEIALLTRNLAVPVLFDAHPGNFVIVDGKAMAVDVEGDFSHAAAVDLAHLTLFSSLLWVDRKAEPLAVADIISFYRTYLRLMDDLQYACLPRFIALRHLVLCRTLSWMFRLLCLAAQGRIDPPADMLQRAHNILNTQNLRKLAMNERDLAEL